MNDKGDKTNQLLSNSTLKQPVNRVFNQSIKLSIKTSKQQQRTQTIARQTHDQLTKQPKHIKANKIQTKTTNKQQTNKQPETKTKHTQTKPTNNQQNK